MTINQVYDKNIVDNIKDLVEKCVIIDTSALLIAGTEILNDLPPCEIIIPSIVVSELEDKRTHSTLGFMAREWLRLFEETRVKHGTELRSGIYLDDFGYPDLKLRIEPNHTSQSSLPSHLQNGSNDSTILAVANNFVIEEFEGNYNAVAVISNDVPMRLFATLDLKINSIGYDYSAINKTEPWNGFVQVFVSDELTAELYNDNTGIPDKIQELIDNEVNTSWAVVQLLTERDENHIVYYMKSPQGLHEVSYDVNVAGITGRTIEQRSALQLLSDDPENLPIVSLGGKAGTGKTLIALAAGVNGVKNEVYEKVLVLRSLHEMGVGQEMGFLPGDSKDKMQPWAGAVYDALDSIMKNKTLNKGKDGSGVIHQTETDEFRGFVEVSPITYLRGRSLTDAYIIIEEAQNFSRYELLNILSRVGEGSKVVLTFDAAQVDNKFLSSGNKADVWGVIDTLKTSELFAHITLKKTERSVVAQLASDTLNHS